MAASARPSDPISIDAATGRVLDQLAAVEASIAADAEAQRTATEVVADLQPLLARMIALGDVAALESLRTHIGVASFDDAVALARRR